MLSYRFIKFAVVLSLLAVCTAMPAQTPVPVPYDRLPYSEGFENADSVAKYWTLNRATPPVKRTLLDKWYTSTAEHFTGRNCLLVSDTVTKGAAAIYSSQYARASSYVEFDLKPGKYDLSFAWRCLGERTEFVEDYGPKPDSKGEGDGLYVGFMSEKEGYVNSSSTYQALSAAFMAAHKKLKGDAESYYNSQYWTVETDTVTVAAAGIYRLWFVWNNDGDKFDYMTPSACIDDIQLTPISDDVCSKPENVTCVANGMDATVSWEGTATGYEVRYQEYGSTTYYATQPAITPADPSGKTSITIKNIRQGLFQFFVRSVCAAGDTSAWVLAGELLLDESQIDACIDFTNLDAAELEVAKMSGILVDYDDAQYKVAQRSEVDFGPATGESRITVHYRPGEVDRRTNGRLRTIPEGEVQSVRLGTWNNDMSNNGYGDGAGLTQTITYNYTVPSTGSNQILLLNYALVLQIPVDGSHDKPDENGIMSNMPRFTLDIFEMVGGEEVQMNPTCHSADFNADYRYLDDPNSGWHGIYKKDTEHINENLELVYKDWSPVGFDLSEFKGKQVRIRLATYDCRQTGHYGYAYFTLRCIEGVGTGYMCGDENQSTLEAPFGFNYQWFRPSDLNTPALEGGEEARIFVDTKPEVGKYKCILTNIQTGCTTDYFVDLRPRRPKCDLVAKPVPNTECKNQYEFVNMSRVEVDGVVSTEEPEYIEWDFGPEYGGINYDERLTLEFPPQGDTITVKLKATINKSLCVDSYDTTVIIPSVMPANGEPIDAQTCGGKPYIFKDENGKEHHLTEPGDTTLVIKNRFGCEYEQKIYLEVYDVDSVGIDSIICQGDSCEFNGQKYFAAGSYRVDRRTSAKGCDSITWLHLVVLDSVIFRSDFSGMACADEPEITLPYEVTQGADQVVGCVLEFDQKALDAGFVNLDGIDISQGQVTVPMPAAVRPDHYSATFRFTTQQCGDFSYTLDFTVGYPSSIMVQKWNDVIALKNAGHNGGYTFASYQWHRNGEPIPGADGPYIYVGADGSTLGTTDTYSALLTRQGENYTVPTCPLVPVEKKTVSDFNTVVNVLSAGQKMVVANAPASGQAQWYTTDGRLISTQPLSAADTQITAPQHSGIYILRLVCPERTELLKVVIK